MISISFTSNLKYNLKQYFEKVFLDAGLFTNVNKTDIYYDSNNPSVLQRCGSVYESMANEWVYELDVVTPSGKADPINVSGVYVDDIFHANDSATYGPKPDYIRGRYTFTTPPPESSVVQAEFSYKDCKIDYVDSTINNILRTQYISNPDYDTSSPFPSGLDRLLPIAIIEPTARGFNPRQLGGGKIIREYVSVMVYSVTDYERDAIADEIYDKVRSVIQAIDYNDVPEILTYEGDRASSYKTYTQLQSSNFWTNVYIDSMDIVERELLNNMIYMTRIDMMVKIYLNP